MQNINIMTVYRDTYSKVMDEDLPVFSTLSIDDDVDEVR